MSRRCGQCKNFEKIKVGSRNRPSTFGICDFTDIWRIPSDYVMINCHKFKRKKYKRIKKHNRKNCYE